uniref:Uncharacterized protein n=1 Tax=Tanacetum cinerariifolium TaxID=118510 RepID=A0A6L2M6V0_TANCI|nr:hypothetical protein [Tanacetum cinerariifolium]
MLLGITYYCWDDVNAVEGICGLAWMGRKVDIEGHGLGELIHTIKCFQRKEVHLQALVDGKKVIITESTVRRNLQLEDAEGIDCLSNAAIFEKLTLIGVGKDFSGRVTPLFPTMMVQDQEEIGKGSVNPTDPHHTPIIIQPSTSESQKTKQHRKPRRKVTEVPQPSDPTTNVADKAVNEEMDDSLERAVTTATSLDVERVKKLKRIKRSRTHGLKRLYKVGLLARIESSKDKGLGEEDASKQGRIADIDANEYIYLVNVYNDKQMFDVDKDLHDTLAQALTELKHVKPKAKAKGIVFHKPEESITTITTTIPKSKSQDKDYQLAKRLQAEEQQELNDEENATLFMQLLEKRRKFFAAKRVEEKRNKPPTQAQQRKIMCTYLKNIEDVETLWKLVKDKHGSIRREGDYERVLWGDLKVMFEPHIEDEVWNMQQRYNIMRWTLFNSCEVHCLSLQSEHIYMLVENRYPLTPVTITDMLNKKLYVDCFDEMTYQLLKLITI